MRAFYILLFHIIVSIFALISSLGFCDLQPVRIVYDLPEKQGKTSAPQKLSGEINVPGNATVRFESIETALSKSLSVVEDGKRYVLDIPFLPNYALSPLEWLLFFNRNGKDVCYGTVSAPSFVIGNMGSRDYVLCWLARVCFPEIDATQMRTVPIACCCETTINAFSAFTGIRYPCDRSVFVSQIQNLHMTEGNTESLIAGLNVVIIGGLENTNIIQGVCFVDPNLWANINNMCKQQDNMLREWGISGILWVIKNRLTTFGGRTEFCTFQNKSTFADPSDMSRLAIYKMDGLNLYLFEIDGHARAIYCGTIPDLFLSS